MVMNTPTQVKPWKQFFTEEDWERPIPEETIYRQLRDACKGYEGYTAINFFDHKISYGELMRRIELAASSFAAMGIKAGDVVPCCSATVPELVYALYGLSKLGATMLTLDPRRSGDEIKDFIVASGSRIVLMLDLAYPHLEVMLKSLNLDKVVIISVDDDMPYLMRKLKQFKVPSPTIEKDNRIISWKTFLAAGQGRRTEVAPYRRDHTAAITLTGGTTGAPKGVEITDLGFSCMVHNFKACGVPYNRNQRYLDIIPAFSSYGLVSSLHMPLVFGLEVVMIPKFEPEKVGHYMKKYKPSHTMLVPSHYERLMQSREVQNGLDLSFLQTIGSGGDTINEGLEEKLNSFFKERGCPYPVSQGYGMSEVSSAASACIQNHVRTLSVGYPLLSTTVSVFKPGTTEELGFNELGELCMSGPALMKGYFNDPEETARTMIPHPDGTVWVHSGDLGYMDEDGFIYIKGRIKRMITRHDGHKVFPIGLENKLGAIEGVASVAVVAIHDPDHAQGMLPLAVCLPEDTADSEAVQDRIFQYCSTEVEERGRPYDVWMVTEMPFTGMGKIDYNKLAEEYELRAEFQKHRAG